MWTLGGDRTRGAKGPRGFRLSGRGRRPWGPWSSPPCGGAPGGAGTQVPACPRRPLRPPRRAPPVTRLCSAAQRAARTSGEHTHLHTWRGAWARGLPAHCHVHPGRGLGHTRGASPFRGPSPADEGAWPPDGVDAAEAGRGRKAALWAWSPAFPTAGSGCPLGPPACEKGGKQRPKRPCVLTSITLTC